MPNKGLVLGAVIAVLFILVLALGSADVRLSNRVQQLEEQLVRAPRREPRTELSALETPVAAPAPAAKTEPKRSDAPAPPAKKDTAGPLAFTVDGGTLTLKRAKRDPVLGLSEGQRKAIEEIRKNRDAQAKAFKDQIQRIDEETDRAIRQLLTPDQLAEYDAPPAVAQALAFQSGDVKTASGAPAGYLGISGDDAPGGGALVTDVSPGSAASRFGLLKDDVILEVNGQPVAGLGALADKIRETGEGSIAQLKIRRGASEFIQASQLGPRPK